MRLSVWDHAAILLSALQIALGVYILNHGAEGALPMHFDLYGNVDRWGDRREVAIILLVCAALNLLAHVLINRAAARSKSPPNSRTLALGRIVGFLTTGLVTALFAAIGPGAFYAQEPQEIVRLILAGSWIVVAACGLLCGKVKPNRWAGVRVSYTFKSRLAWEKSNRLLGRIYFFGGIAGLLATALLPQLWLAPLFILVIVGGAVASYVEARRTWANDPERLP